MKIFALETNVEKLKRELLSPQEQALLEVHFHGFLFVVRALKIFFWLFIFISALVLLAIAGIPVFYLIMVGLVLAVPAFLFRMLRAFLDWKYDLIFLTTDKIVVVDQSSLFHRKVRQMNLENLASVTAETQFFNLLPFGGLHFDLKEGTGRAMRLPYIPSALDVASHISDAMVAFQRRGNENVTK